MSVDLLYGTVPGRSLMALMMKCGFFPVASFFLNTNLSKAIIPCYIRKNKIDMTPFREQKFNSFSEFFSRKKKVSVPLTDPRVLASPCDGSLSIYSISDDMDIRMKGSHYQLSDLIPDENTAKAFCGGLCLVFRLKGSDYHRFHCFDDMLIYETNYVPGILHSIQPLACRHYPVYRLNRRWWSPIMTKHFNNVVQIEIGAMFVGDVKFTGHGILRRGDEMGYFTLAGSTIVLIFDPEVKHTLELSPLFQNSINSEIEIPVKIGDAIGIRNEKDYQIIVN